MNYMRFSGLLVTAGAAALLSGCVVAPIGHDPYAAYPSASVYVEPAPIVVVPAPRHHGYHGYRGYRGHRYWR